jgi:Ribbon-helix-helix protein, copG family
MPVDKDKTVRTSVIVPADLYQRVQQLAASNDVSAAWIVRHALIEFLAGHGGEQAIPLKFGDTRTRSPGGRGRKRAETAR